MANNLDTRFFSDPIAVVRSLGVNTGFARFTAACAPGHDAVEAAFQVEWATIVTTGISTTLFKTSADLSWWYASQITVSSVALGQVINGDGGPKKIIGGRARCGGESPSRELGCGAC